MQFAEPDRVEADLISQLDLGDDVVVALLLRKARRTGQLVEKPEAHAASPARCLRLYDGNLGPRFIATSFRSTTLSAVHPLP
jgi:hypothetical protein